MLETLPSRGRYVRQCCCCCWCCLFVFAVATVVVVVVVAAVILLLLLLSSLLSDAPELSYKRGFLGPVLYACLLVHGAGMQNMLWGLCCVRASLYRGQCCVRAAALYMGQDCVRAALYRGQDCKTYSGVCEPASYMQLVD